MSSRLPLPTNTIGGSFASSASARVVTLPNPTTTGNGMALIIATKVPTTGTVTLTILDGPTNLTTTFTLGENSVSSVTGSSLRTYYCLSITGNASHAITVTPSTACELDIVAIELAPISGFMVRGDFTGASSAASGVGTSAEVDVAPVGGIAVDELCIGVVFQTSNIGVGDTTTITPQNPGDGLPTTVYQDNGISDQTLPISVLATAGKSIDGNGNYQQFQWTLSASQTWRAVCISFFPVQKLVAPVSQPPFEEWDARSCLSFLGKASPTIPETNGGASAVLGPDCTLSAYVSLGINCLCVSCDGSGHGIVLPWTTGLGAILGVMSTQYDTAASLIGMDNVGSGTLGAFYVAKDASNNLSGQIVTGSDAAFTDGGVGTGMGAIPTSLWITLTGTTATVEQNGFVVATKTLTGSQPTPHASNPLRQMNAWVSGGDATPAIGEWFLARVYSPTNSPSDAQKRLTDKDVYSLLGRAANTLRYTRFGFNDGTATSNGLGDIAMIGGSSNAKDFGPFERVLYNPPLSTQSVRDPSFRYSQADKCYYGVHTLHGFGLGASYQLVKAKDPRAWVPIATVDCSSVINGSTNTVWAPRFYPAKQDVTPTDIIFEKNDTGQIYRQPITSLSAGTFGAIVTMSGTSVDDAQILRPGDPGNNTGKFLMFGGAPNICYQTSTAVDGTYNTRTSIDSTGNANEGCQYLVMDDGSSRMYATGNGGNVYWQTSAVANDLTNPVPTTPTATTGEAIPGNLPYYIGQGTVFDAKVVGLWPIPVASGSSAGLNLGLGISL